MMNKSALYPLVLLFWLFGCAELAEISPADYPRIQTLGVTDINEDGVVFHGKIVERGNEPITDHGFIWGTFSTQRSISLGPLNAETFSSPVDYGLSANRELQVRSYVLTPTDTVFGNPITFFSLGGSAPVIDSFEPTSGLEGDTVVISGSNFNSVIGDVLVFFGGFPARVLSASFNKLVVVAPATLTFAEVRAPIIISQDGKTETSESVFIFESAWSPISKPEEHFRTFAAIEYNGKMHIFQAGAFNNQVKIWEFKPDDTSWTLLQKTTDFFNGSGDALQVGSKLAFFTDLVTETNGVHSGHYDLYDPVTQALSRVELPILEYPGGKSKVYFSVNSEAYIGLGADYDENGVLGESQQTFKKFNLETQTSTEIAPCPGVFRDRALAFSWGGFGFVGIGTGRKDIWKYDATNNTWTQRNSFPAEAHHAYHAITIQDRTFVFTWHSTERGINVWEFEAGSSWKLVNSAISGTAGMLKPFAIGSKIYLPILYGTQGAGQHTEFFALDIDQL